MILLIIGIVLMGLVAVGAVVGMYVTLIWLALQRETRLMGVTMLVLVTGILCLGAGAAIVGPP